MACLCAPVYTDALCMCIGSPEQRTIFMQMFAGRIVELSMQMYGCRVMQKIAEFATSTEQVLIVSELTEAESVLRCVQDHNGNHVIQKCIEFLPPETKHPIVRQMYGQVWGTTTSAILVSGGLRGWWLHRRACSACILMVAE